MKGMKWKNIFPLLVVAIADADWHKEVIYTEINKFRSYPVAYLYDHPNIRCRCSEPLDKHYNLLNVSRNLENSSHFHAETSASEQCPIVSHSTCILYCDRFGGCSFINRIAWFLRGVSHYNHTFEIMMLGPKNPYKIFYEFLHSQKHCNHILNPNINSMGASFAHGNKNIFVADFANL